MRAPPSSRSASWEVRHRDPGLADVALLVRYCYQHVNGCICQSPRFRPLSSGAWRQQAATEDFRRKGRPARATSNSVGRAGFKAMIASGWQTAPPRTCEVVLVTNSACPPAPQAFSRVPDPSSAAPLATPPGRERGRAVPTSRTGHRTSSLRHRACPYQR